ncbi:hypothetical protein T484DRAFT_1923021, partial [Baffinella frigidus]
LSYERGTPVQHSVSPRVPRIGENRIQVRVDQASTKSGEPKVQDPQESKSGEPKVEDQQESKSGEPKVEG